MSAGEGRNSLEDIKTSLSHTQQQQQQQQITPLQNKSPTLELLLHPAINVKVRYEKKKKKIQTKIQIIQQCEACEPDCVQG